jgi:hypothetical protein
MFKTLGWMALLPLLVVIIGVFLMQLLIMNIKSGGSGIGVSEGLIAVIGIVCWISISLSLPISILVGFIGRSELVNGCMSCGFKWTPAKRK